MDVYCGLSKHPTKQFTHTQSDFDGRVENTLARHIEHEQEGNTL